jgi:hypothetical protein
MQIQLSWEDPITEEQQELIFPLPLALGRELAQLPQEWQGREVARAVFASQEISRYHALVYLGEDGQVIYEDRSANGSRINGEKIRQARRVLQGGEVVELGPYSITVGLVSPRDPNATLLTATPTLLLEPRTELIRPATQPDTAFEVPPASTVVFAPEQLPEVRPGSDFPPPDLFRAEQIALSALKATGLPVEETLYLALGGGIGSFVWVDTLRIYGVRPEHIRVISIARKPYERYERLLTNCQIPPLEANSLWLRFLSRQHLGLAWLCSAGCLAFLFSPADCWKHSAFCGRYLVSPCWQIPIRRGRGMYLPQWIGRQPELVGSKCCVTAIFAPFAKRRMGDMWWPTRQRGPAIRITVLWWPSISIWQLDIRPSSCSTTCRSFANKQEI